METGNAYFLSGTSSNQHANPSEFCAPALRWCHFIFCDEVFGPIAGNPFWALLPKFGFSISAQELLKYEFVPKSQKSAANCAANIQS